MFGVWLFFFFVVYTLYATKHPTECHLNSHPRGTKWIVITSINYPTSAVKAMCALQDWHTVIVADVSTPTDWAFPGCILLTVQEQLNCFPRFQLPVHSYTRKAYGYLFAIQRGAQWLLDTDDDNELKVLPQIETNFNMSLARMLVSGFASGNPYAAFGQPHIWPRGAALEWLHKKPITPVYTDAVDVAIVQGLANLDPDVDALWRLTHLNQIGHIHFDEPNSPLIVPKDMLVPFNSQNTLFHYTAFWGLFLPTTTSFRVCDIWRGYWTERILWELDQPASLIFTQATVDQVRNAHRYTSDMVEETQLYEQSGQLINFLKDFKGSETAELSQFIIQLSTSMARAGFWGWEDVDLIEKWLHELNKAEYSLPARK